MIGRFELIMGLAWFALLAAIPIAVWISLDHLIGQLPGG